MRETRFSRHFRSQAFKTYAFQEGRARRPFARFLKTPGFTYLRVGPVIVIRDGWRLVVRTAN